MKAKGNEQSQAFGIVNGARHRKKETSLFIYHSALKNS
jgi:hypothetical protein